MLIFLIFFLKYVNGGKNKYKMNRPNAPLKFTETIAPNSSFVLNLSNPNTDDEGTQTDLYAPLRNLTIFNLSTNANIEYFINADQSGKLVPAGVIDTQEDKNINNIRVTNLSTTNSVNIVLQFNNDETLLSLKKRELGLNN